MNTTLTPIQLVSNLPALIDRAGSRPLGVSLNSSPSTSGITDYLTNGGKLEIAQRMAGHSNAKTTSLYDRRNDDISISEVERVGT
jgi:hypothetical protein